MFLLTAAAVVWSCTSGTAAGTVAVAAAAAAATTAVAPPQQSEFKDCSANPCGDHGKCGANNPGGTCIGYPALEQYCCECDVGYSGVDCEIQTLMAYSFATNMVLQANSPLTSIYGNPNATTPHDTITIVVTPAAAVGNRSPFTATAGVDGSWVARLGNMKSSKAVPLSITATSKASGMTQTISNVLRGDVRDRVLQCVVCDVYTPGFRDGVAQHVAESRVAALSRGLSPSLSSFFEWIH